MNAQKNRAGRFMFGGNKKKEETQEYIECKYTLKKVRVSGLKSKPELNGHTGFAVSFNSETLRYNVKLSSGSVVALKAENLEQITSSGTKMGYDVPSVVVLSPLQQTQMLWESASTKEEILHVLNLTETGGNHICKADLLRVGYVVFFFSFLIMPSCMWAQQSEGNRARKRCLGQRGSGGLFEIYSRRNKARIRNYYSSRK